ncbi:MAG: NAD-dependent epimerase/dehydratase family protein [Synechococcales cyanobacterium T60_A2020_003]|nr:NAD-dependent epimerase/dehydratase family protein [Synechococcales cyanobacterium T60_A2020_003]
MKLGTVVVTGANGQVGHTLLPVLQEQWDVIALVRSPVSLPVMEVIPDWIHSSSTQGAIAQADAVVHLAGSLKPKKGDYVGANV